MKIVSIILAIVALVGCKSEPDRDQQLAVEEPELVTEQVSEENSLIPSYNYDELEQAYFSPKNDSIYVLNFWATWCKPCVKELPAFEQLNKEYASKQVKVILVSLDFPENVESHVVPFMEKKNLESTVVLLDDDNANRWITLVDEKWSGAIPATLIIDKNGRRFYEQSFTFTEIENEVKSFIK